MTTELHRAGVSQPSPTQVLFIQHSMRSVDSRNCEPSTPTTTNNKNSNKIIQAEEIHSPSVTMANANSRKITSYPNPNNNTSRRRRNHQTNSLAAQPSDELDDESLEEDTHPEEDDNDIIPQPTTNQNYCSSSNSSSNDPQHHPQRQRQQQQQQPLIEEVEVELDARKIQSSDVDPKSIRSRRQTHNNGNGLATAGTTGTTTTDHPHHTNQQKQQQQHRPTKSVGDDTERGDALEGLSELVPGLVEELEAAAAATGYEEEPRVYGENGGDEETNDRLQELALNDSEPHTQRQARQIRNLDSMVAVMSMSTKDLRSGTDRMGAENGGGGVDGPDDEVSDNREEDDDCSYSSSEESSYEVDAAGPPPVLQRRQQQQQQEQLLTNAVLDGEEEVSSSSSGSTVARTHSSMGNRERLKSEQNLENMEEGEVPSLPSRSQIQQQQQQQQHHQHKLNNTSKPNNNINNNNDTRGDNDNDSDTPQKRTSSANIRNNNNRNNINPYSPTGAVGLRPISPSRQLRPEFTTAIHSSTVSLSTATQTAASIPGFGGNTRDDTIHGSGGQMPMCLPNFRPATGCTNASDFIVRCFVARLRSGIQVTKHGRSRWCKSRHRILHIHNDGKCLSWKAAQGEPTSNKRPPRLDLTTCIEVRHAWTPDPLNPMFTGTSILRQKCEAANAFKSFALIFGRRTVDITAVTADQCKVLMEGFSALCFRLQVASATTPKAVKEEGDDEDEEEEEDSTDSSSGKDDYGGKREGERGKPKGRGKGGGGDNPMSSSAMSFGR